MPKRTPQHRAPRPKFPDRRPSASKRGYDEDWKRLREAFLAENPLCVAILRDGRRCGRPAKHVDHKTTINSGGERLDPANLQALCASCHSRKTVYCDNGLNHAKGKRRKTF